MSSIIETYGYARAGFLGNPSDGYFGKTISFSIMDFRARVLLYPSARLEIKPSKADLPIFERHFGDQTQVATEKETRNYMPLPPPVTTHHPLEPTGLS